jgi:hypothetical protein
MCITPAVKLNVGSTFSIENVLGPRGSGIIAVLSIEPLTLHFLVQQPHGNLQLGSYYGSLVGSKKNSIRSMPIFIQ